MSAPPRPCLRLPPRPVGGLAALLSLLLLGVGPLLLWGCSSVPPTGAPAEPSSPATDPAPSASSPTPPQREPVVLLPVPGKSIEGSAQFEADWSFDVRVTEAFSVHVHVIPPGQLVPLHHHPDRWELTFVASGEGEFAGVSRGPEGNVRLERRLGVGSAMVAPPGASHEVRNRGAELLAAVVVHQPKFGQNWYQVAEEVTNITPIRFVPASGDDLAATLSAPAGWLIGWTEGEDAPSADARERILLVAAGQGRLQFEDQDLPLSTGDVAKVPPGLAHRVVGGTGLRVLSLQVPRSP